MIFGEEVDRILDILHIDRKTVDLYQKRDLESLVKELKDYNNDYDEGYKDGYVQSEKDHGWDIDFD